MRICWLILISLKFTNFIIPFLEKTNHDLLLAIIGTSYIDLDYAGIAARLGPNCSKRAVQEQMKKLRKVAFGDGPAPSKTKGSAKAKEAEMGDALVEKPEKGSTGTGSPKKLAPAKRITKEKAVEKVEEKTTKAAASTTKGLKRKAEEGGVDQVVAKNKAKKVKVESYLSDEEATTSIEDEEEEATTSIENEEGEKTTSIEDEDGSTSVEDEEGFTSAEDEDSA